ncbi:MAG: GntR family transcriptional regulator [Candidatus Aminicenantes bacterium]|nr:GntR family transcriptional regulator [Candidatus Aminicenantes bacterium]
MDNKKSNTERFVIPKTLSQSIHDYLRKSILKNELKSKQRINEKEIADLFQVSRTPVREAVVRLAAEGFVEIISHREALVKEVSYKELKEIFQVLGVLDKLAIGLIVGYIESSELTQLEKMTNRLERAYIVSEVEKFIELNYAIHEILWNSLKNKNEFLMKELNYCANQVKMCSYPLTSAFKNPKIMKKSMIAHKEIIEALKNRNKQKLETVVYDHWVPPLP